MIVIKLVDWVIGYGNIMSRIINFEAKDGHLTLIKKSFSMSNPHGSNWASFETNCLSGKGKNLLKSMESCHFTVY